MKIKTISWAIYMIINVFFFDDFLQLGDKKKELVNPTNGFLRFLKTNSPYLD
jgi:hypothetical protein